MSSKAIRFGVWAPVHGPRAAWRDPAEPFNASWEHNRDVVLAAEALGFDSTLIAQHTVNPHLPDHDQLETWTGAAALAALTQRIEIIAAIKPPLFHPMILAKMALQIENISRGRFAINLINAWNKQEYERAGIPFDEHDARYAYGREWLSIVRRLTSGETVDHVGPHFQISALKLTPNDLYRPRPRIYLGGESEPARALAAELADVWFINGQPIERVKDLIADVRKRPRQGSPVGFGLSAFVIARETEAEAQQYHARLRSLAQADAADRAALKAKTDPNVVMHQTLAALAPVGTNGGTAAGLVGSYEQVAERIEAFQRVGIDLFMLQFQPLVAEMRDFAEHIFPLLGKSVGDVSGSLSNAPAHRIAS
jgi:alkanesulfonate monooxygenase